MRRARAGAALVAALVAASAAAQQPGALGEVPAGEGRIAVRLIHPDGAARVAGADLILYSLEPGGRAGARRASADREGRFAFAGVSTAPDVAYLVGARHDEVPFVSERLGFASGEREKQVEIALVPRTRDPREVSVEEATLRFERIGGELVVAQSFRLRNAGTRVVFASASERAAGAEPAFRALLPAGADAFAWPYAVTPEGVEQAGDEVRFFGPIYPGEQEIAFRFSLAAPEGASELALRFPSGAARLAISHPAGLALGSPQLAPAPAPEAEAGLRVLEARGVRPGARIVLRLELPAARRDPDLLALRSVRSFLELDDVALSVSEEYQLAVQGDAPLVAPDDRPLLRIPIPQGARDLRFGAREFAGGVTFEEGALLLRGPVPPGEANLEVRFRLPAGADGAQRLQRSFDRRVPVLSIYVADTGLAVEAPRLHRLRPVRAPDERLFMHFEAFYVEPDEAVEIALVPLARGGPGRGARTAFVIAAAAATALFLVAPLRGSRAQVADTPEASAARGEREALYAALRDLDHDFEVGKVSAEDHAAMRRELRARAAASLKSEREGPADPTPMSADTGVRADRACAACQAPAADDARFCARCGRSLESAGEARA